MAETYKRRYGLDWPHSVSDIYIDLILAKKWKLEPYKHGNLLDPGEHMVRAIKALFTPEQWTVSPWTEQHAHAWAAEDFSVWLGAASTGKAVALDELVMTTTGPTPMGDLCVGDYVVGRSGKPTRITATHDAGILPEYVVSTADGRSSRCANTHLWSVNTADTVTLCTLKTIDLIPNKHMLPSTGRVEFDPSYNCLDTSYGRAYESTTIVKVEPTGRIVPMKCITVDAPDGLYLTGSFMPTHNSNDAGGLAVLDWITDPFETYIALASTSVPMLKLRSFESVTRYFRALKKNPQFLIPGKESASMTAIINDNDSDDGDATSKASIRGVALADGDESKAVARLAGAHLPYVTIILDEGSALPAAAAKARFNAAAGAKRFRFLSLANPVSQFDEATKFCVPIDGWASVGPDSDSWRSKYGLVLHHNGFKSPAITEPDGENKYPFLINQPQIDRMLNEVGGNTDDPMIWCMVAGFPTPQGVESTVLAPVDLTAFHARETAVWREGVDFIDVAGADPAFVSEGDGCIMQRARVGVTREGLYSISFFPPDKIPIGVSAPRPGAYQAADGIIALAHEHHIPISSIAVDDSGTQSVCDILEVEAGKKPIRCNFASRSTEMEAVDGDKVPRPKYRNLVTELWHQVARLVRENQVRDLPEAAAAQLCSRRYRRDVKPLTLEGKKDYKKRQVGQRSPDEADALALCCFAAMRVAGLHPGKPRRYVATNNGQVVPGSNSAMRSPSVDYTRGMDDTPMSSYMNSGGRI